MDGPDPDKDDRHVLAAVVSASADLIVTWNLRDFPAGALSPYGIQARTPDDFVFELVQDARPAVWTCLQQIADARRLRPQGADDVLHQRERDGLSRSVALLTDT